MIKARVIRWVTIWLVINVFMGILSYASHIEVETAVLDSFFEQMNGILDDRKKRLGSSFTIPSNRGSYALNIVMTPSEDALGDTGETYLVKEISSGECQLASKSRFEGYNDDDGVHACTNHWTEVLAGQRTEGAWLDYRNVEVYGVGARITRNTTKGRTTFAVIVERDVADVQAQIRSHSLVLVCMVAGLGFLSFGYCAWGYISERRAIQSALENKLTLENVPSGIIRVGKNRNIQSVNIGMAKMFGYDSEDELLHKNVDILFPESCIQEDIDSFNRAMAGSAEKSDLKLHFEGKKRDYTVFPLELTRHVVDFPEGRQILKVFVDRTEEVEARERVERKNEQLRMIGRISRHDVLNNLSVVQTALAFIKEAGMDAETFDMAKDETDAAIDLLQSLSVWSKLIESDGEDMERDNESVNAMIQAVMPEGIKYDMEELGTIDCNKGLMQAVFRNVLENSSKYCPTDPVIRIWRDGNDINVQDNSGGFACTDGVYDSDYAKRLMMPSQRGDHDIAGSGLGLANCHAILNTHGYTFSHTSECGAGTIWHITVK